MDNKYLAAIVMAVALLFGYIGGKISHPRQKMLSAECYYLDDREGKTRGTFGCGLGDNPQLSLMDKNGKMRANFEIGYPDHRNFEHPMITLYDANGAARTKFGIADLQTTQDGTTTIRPEAALVFYDEKGQETRVLPK